MRGSRARLRTSSCTLEQLYVDHRVPLPLGNANAPSDVLSDAYEYLIEQFADSTNKKAGEFNTPRSIVRLMVEILNPAENAEGEVWEAAETSFYYNYHRHFGFEGGAPAKTSFGERDRIRADGCDAGS